MNKAQLRWACRRGMLELDLVLLPFFEENFDKFSLEEQKKFEQFLKEADQDLYAWVFGFQDCPYKHYALLLECIQNHL